MSYYKHTGKKVWVPVSFATMVTGWNSEKMRQARNQGIIECEDQDGHMMYNIDSIHPHFVVTRIINIQKADASTSASHNQ